MKTELTIEESVKLVKLGVDPKLASKCNSTMKVCTSGRGIIRVPETMPIFTLSDLLSILPKEIEDEELSIEWSKRRQKWEVGYGTAVWSYCSSSELILVLGCLLSRVLKRGFINTKEEKK